MFVRFQVLTAASMMFIVVFWDILPCNSETSVDNNFTRPYIPEDNSEHHGCLCLYVVLSCVGRRLCDGMIGRAEESYRASNCM
jgi:hypothetical protein